MKVFLATGGYDYEGYDVFGVFTTEEKALAHLKTIDARYFDTRGVVPFEMDVGLSYP